MFIGLVVVHEFGHFIAARRNGVEVEEFGIGFPPRAATLTRKKGTVFTLNWLPLGGFVRLKGENDAANDSGSYGSARLWAKVKITMAGIVMNLLVAFVLLTLLALIGLPRLIENQFSVKSDTKVIKQDILVGYVEPGSPADKAGLKARDKLVSYGEFNVVCIKAPCPPLSIPINDAAKLPEITKSLAGQTVKFNYQRNGQVLNTEVSLRTHQEVEASKKTDNPKGYLGISPAEYALERSTWSAPIRAAGLMWQMTVLTLKAIGSALAALFVGNTAQASAQVAGPVGIFVLIKDGSLLGYQFILTITAIISLTLAIINALPIPALDGGRLFITLLFRFLNRIFGRNITLTKTWEDGIHGTGFALLMVLFVLITIVDIRRFF